jgi:hypothetical protein
LRIAVKSRLFFRLAHSVLLAAVASSCASIIGADFDAARKRPESTSPVDASKPDASGNASDAASEASAPVCDPLSPPGKRSGGTASPADTVEITVVLKEVDFGDGGPDGGAPRYGEKGYDLDGVCTVPGPSSCTPQPWIGDVTSDGPRGQDNAIGRLLQVQKAEFGVQAAGTAVDNDAVARGADAPTAVLRVKNFGGLSEDERVEVDWFVPAPLEASADGGVKAPAFDASDSWPILSTTVADATVKSAADTVSKDRDESAYVTRNLLVAHFDHVVIPLRNSYFDTYDVVLTGELRRDIATKVWSIENGTFAGHAHVDDLLAVIPEIAHTIFGATLCTDNTLNYAPVKRYICNSADMPATPAGGPCTETSFGIGFTTAPASLGAVVAPPPPSDVCPRATSPASDSCSIPAQGGG